MTNLSCGKDRAQICRGGTEDYLGNTQGELEEKRRSFTGEKRQAQVAVKAYF